MQQKRSITIIFLILIACVFTSSIVYNVKPVSAFKPNSHIQAANVAISEILAGSNTITIDGKKYQLDPRVADAIRRYPDFYRGGVIGPDGFPDIYVGQSKIHPDNSKETQKSVTHQWLRHVYDSAWADYQRLRGNEEAKKILAFAYGFLTHAAGDMWAHTLVNEYARGIFPGPKEIAQDIQRLGIAIRHIVVESYIGKHTPSTNLRIDAPTDFIYRTLIDNPTAKRLGNGDIFGHFFALKDRLIKSSDSLKRQADDFGSRASACKWYDFTCSAIALRIQQGIANLKRTYVIEWIRDVDRGLRDWPNMSLAVARALFGQESPNIEAAKRAVRNFAYDPGLSMLGAPDFFGSIAKLIAKITDFVTDTLGPLARPLREIMNRLQNYVILQITGIDIEALKDFYSRPENYINTNRIIKIGNTNIGVGLASDTSVKLDNLMGIRDGFQNPNAKYNPELFAAAKNTIVLSKLLLLSPDTLNQVAKDRGVTTQLYRPGNNGPGAPNAMLDFVKSIDAHHQWMTFSPRDKQSYGTGMPIWKDCLARERVFAVIFTDWERLPVNQRCPYGLTGIWRGSDGGTYYMTQFENTLSWNGLSADDGRTFNNIFRGTVTSASNTITGEWVDVPRGTFMGQGVLSLKIVSPTMIQKVSQTGSGFGATTWQKVDIPPPPPPPSAPPGGPPLRPPPNLR
jgi:hypothetical protein